MYNSTQVASERNLWLRSLASSNEPYIIQQYLDSVFNRSKVRSQDVRTVIATIAKNPAGSQVVLCTVYPECFLAEQKHLFDWTGVY